MKRALSSVAVLALGVLALTGCSSGSEPAASASTSAGSTVLAGITARGLGLTVEPRARREAQRLVDVRQGSVRRLASHSRSESGDLGARLVARSRLRRSAMAW